MTKLINTDIDTTSSAVDLLSNIPCDLITDITYTCNPDAPMYCTLYITFENLVTLNVGVITNVQRIYSLTVTYNGVTSNNFAYDTIDLYDGHPCTFTIAYDDNLFYLHIKGNINSSNLGSCAVFVYQKFETTSLFGYCGGGSMSYLDIKNISGGWHADGYRSTTSDTVYNLNPVINYNRDLLHIDYLAYNAIKSGNSFAIRDTTFRACSTLSSCGHLVAMVGSNITYLSVGCNLLLPLEIE